MNNGPVDFEKLMAMGEEIGDANEFIGELIDQYLKDAPGRITAMEKAIATDDAHALKEQAHTLKGSSGTLCAEGIVELCSQLEKRATDKSVKDAQEILKSLNREYECARDALEGFQKKLGESPQSSQN